MFRSFLSFRSTEPKIFNILRLLSVIALTFGLCFYTWISVVEFVSNIYKPDVYFSEGVNSYDKDYNLIGFTYPGFRICPNTSNSYDDNDSLEISLHYLYRDELNSTLFFDNGLNENSLHPYNPNMTYDLHNNPENDKFFDKDNRCRIFNSQISVGGITVSSRYLHGGLLFIITLDNSSNYDYFEINFNSINTTTTLPSLFGKPFEDEGNLSFIPNQHFIVRGQYVIYEFAIKRQMYYSSPFYGIFGFKANEEATHIEINEETLASMQNTSFTVLELRYKSSYIRDEEERYQITVGKLISNLGGFYSAVSGIFILLFGAPKLSPWGICQTSLLCCWPIRRSFKKHLASRYVSHAGIPLAEDPREMPQGAKIEDRVAVLEHLLKEYYLDAYYLEKLRTTRNRYLKLQEQYNDLEGDQQAIKNDFKYQASI
ncbi:7273_t:CDS:2 [Rhizophagus irregularis]|nr:7273_t:CDS:2 [Rhizophagus irregularis]